LNYTNEISFCHFCRNLYRTRYSEATTCRDRQAENKTREEVHSKLSRTLNDSSPFMRVLRGPYCAILRPSREKAA